MHLQTNTKFIAWAYKRPKLLLPSTCTSISGRSKNSEKKGFCDKKERKDSRFSQSEERAGQNSSQDERILANLS